MGFIFKGNSMDKKVQKKEIIYSKFRTNGFLLDLVIKGLGIEQKEEKLQKVYQRFVKEEDIASEEYHDTLNIIISDILYQFLDGYENPKYKYLEKEIKELLSVYNYIKVNIETLAIPQKELDFIIIMHLFIPFINFLINSIGNNQILNEMIPSENRTSIQKLFNIINRTLDKDVKELLTTILKDDKNIKMGYNEINKNIDNWIKGEHVPSSENITLISNISRFSNKFNQQELKNYFQLSKLMQFIYDKSINYFGEIKTQQLLAFYKMSSQINSNNYLPKNKEELAKVIYLFIKNLQDSKSKSYWGPLDTLYKKLSYSKEKTLIIEDEINAIFDLFETEYETENDPYYSFVKARYYAQRREYKKATQYYLTSLEYGKNCMGIHIQQVIREGLFVSSQDTRKNQLDLINAKSNFTKFYKEAYFYKLLDNLPDEINIYFLNDMKKQFDLYFKNLFPNIKKAKDGKTAKDLGIVLNSDVAKIKVDLQKPNKAVKCYKNDEVQLTFFSLHANYVTVKDLIKHGADVNYKREFDNYTALIATLQNKIETNNLKIAKLLIPKMNTEILNTKSPKKEMTALSLAIERGLVDIVELLIKNNVDINQKATLNEVTPLYQSIEIINIIDKGIRSSHNSINDKSKFIKTNPLEDKEELKKLLKLHNYPNLVFDEEKEKYLLNQMNDPKFKKINEVLTQLEYSLEYFYHNNIDNAYKIFDLLLDATDNVDIPHKENITCLIFATELNNKKLVKKLLDKGANPDYQTNQFATAYDYAKMNKNQELMDLLE